MLFTPSDSEGEYQIGKQNMQADSFNSNIKELRQSSGCVHPLCRGFPLAVVPLLKQPSSPLQSRVFRMFCWKSPHHRVCLPWSF